jgi:hypothetical protein
MPYKNCECCGDRFYNSHSQTRFCSTLCYGKNHSRATHPNLKEDYFESIDTKEKAYWLGFMYADGVVQEKHQKRGGVGYRAKIILGIKDEDQVDRFIKCVGADAKRKIFSTDLRGRHFVGIQLYNKIFAGHLINQGCIPKKSFVITLPDFNDAELDLAFFLGFFDGDGCISGCPSFCSASYKFVEMVKAKYNVIHKTQSRLSSTGNTIYSQYIGKKLLQEMLNNYQDSMPRKRLLKYKPKISPAKFVYKDIYGWSVSISRNRSQKHIGFYKDLEQAKQVASQWYTENQMVGIPLSEETLSKLGCRSLELKGAA